MQAIELSAEIDKNRQIHLKLPSNISAQKANAIIMLQDELSKKINRIIGLHSGKIEMSDDFDEPLPDSFRLGNGA